MISNIEKPPEYKEITPPQPSRIEYYLELIFDQFSKGIRLVGPFFAFALTVFISIVTHAFFNVILPFYTTHYGLIFSIALILIALYTLFNLIFNYFMAVLVKPGSMKDFKTSRYYKKHNPMKIDTELVNFYTVFDNSENRKVDKQQNVFQFRKNFAHEDSHLKIDNYNQSDNNTQSISEINRTTEDPIHDLSKIIDNKIGCVTNINENDLLEKTFRENQINLLNFNNNIDELKKKELNNNSNREIHKITEESSYSKNINIYIKGSLNTSVSFPQKISKCKYCKELKVIRSHHCQVCGICVFKMDHHCPWINNCVGHFNHRYFILFLTWLLLGCLYVSSFSAPILFYSPNLKKSKQFSFVWILCLTGVIILTFFNTWNWFLVFRGNTTIEFWSLKSGFKTNCIIKDYSLNNWRDNLFLVFGTRSILQAIFCASKRKLPVSGLEWTRLSIPEFRLDSEFFMEENDEKSKILANSDV